MKFFLVVGVLLSCAVHGQAGDAFGKINAYLEKTVESDDPEANLQAAKVLLLKETQSSHCLKPFHTKIAGPLEKFILLADLQGPNHCDWNSHLIFADNNELTGGKARQESDPARRIDRLVRRYTVDHATACKNVYRTKFAEIVDGFARNNPERFNSVREFVDPLMKILTSIERFMATRTNHKIMMRESTRSLTDIFFDMTLLDFAFKKVTISGKNPNPELPLNQLIPSVLKSPTRNLLWNVTYSMYVTAAYSTIKNSAAAPDLDEPIDEARWAELFKKYITEPCEFYTTAVGQDAIEPTAYDNAFAPEEYKESDIEFYKGWFRYEICMNVITGDSIKLFKEMMALIRGDSTKIGGVALSRASVKELLEARETILEFFKELN